MEPEGVGFDAKFRRTVAPLTRSETEADGFLEDLPKGCAGFGGAGLEFLKECIIDVHCGFHMGILMRRGGWVKGVMGWVRMARG